MKTVRIIAALLACLSAAISTTTAFAQTKVKAKTAVPASTKISADQAKKIALNKYKGKVTKAPLLEKEDGKWQWEVIVIGKSNQMIEVNVDASTGKITSTEKVTAKEEAKEKTEKKKKG